MPDPADQGYIEVHERILEFYERFPTGSLQGEFEFRDCLAVDVEGQPFQQTLIVYCARAYRGQDDELPGIGFASEPFPGLTPFTRNSELMNAETSAWGRALAAIGIAVKSGVASANEVRARTGGSTEQKGFASEKQEKYLRRLLSDADFRDPNLIVGYLAANFSGGRDGGISRAIDGLKDESTRADTLAKLDALAVAWDAEQVGATPEAPPDDDDLPTVDEVLAENGGIAPLADEPEQPTLG